MTSRSAWKRAESSAGAIFGARRRPLSGSANRPDIEGDDVIHPRLWIESKLRAKCAVRSLWDKTREAARKCVRVYQGGHKVPVLVLRAKHRPGALVVVHADDLAEVVVEWLSAREDGQLLEIEAAVRRRRELSGEGDDMSRSSAAPPDAARATEP